MRRFAYVVVLCVTLVFGIILPSIAQPIQLRFLAESSGDFALLLQKQIEGFNASQSGINVEFIPFSGQPTDYEAKILSGAAAGTLADVFTTHDNTTRSYVHRGVLAKAPDSFAEYMQGAATRSLKEGILQEIVVNGHVYGAPWVVDWIATWYNVDMFEEAGLEGAPSTWDELVEYTQKLVKYDAGGQVERSGISLRLSGHPAGILHKFYTFFTAAGGDIFGSDQEGNLTSTVDTPGMREALNLYLDLLYKYKVDAPGIPHDTDAFAQGLTAMYHREPAVWRHLAKTAPDMRIASALVPDHTYKARNRSFIDTIVVYERSKNKEAAWEFVQWMMEPDREAERASLDYQIPLLEESQKSDLFAPNPFIFAWIDEDIYIPPGDSRVYEIETTIGRYLERLFLQQMSLEDSLKKAQGEVNAILKRK